MKLNNTYRNSLFFLFLLIISYLYNYHEILFHGPWLPHMWRQADCLSITMNYFKGGLSFLTPEVHWTGPEGHGRTMSEFPLIYFSVAKLWMIFGKHYAIYKIVNILFVFSGLFSLYKISYKILKDNFWAYFIPLFLFTSPALVFYTNNFLANAPAFGLALTGAYFYLNFTFKKKRKWLYGAVVCFTLAGLLKITSLIIFVATFIFLFVQAINLLIKKKENIRNILAQFFPFFIVVAITIIWYLYAINYNSKNIENIFLQGLFPIWDLSYERILEICNNFYWKILPSFFNKKALAFVMVLFLTVVLFLIRKGNKVIFIVLISFGGIILYILLWFRALGKHDYYIINLLVIIPLILIGFLFELKERSFNIFKNVLVKSVAFIALLFLVYQTSLINRLKYDVNDPFLKADLFLDEEDYKYWTHKQNNYNKTLKALETITPYLRSLGINRDDLVISIPDVSINISLCLMDQKGFSDYGYAENKGKIVERIENFKRIGAKYLIVNKDNAVKAEEFSPYLTNKIGEYKNVKIYKL